MSIEIKTVKTYENATPETGKSTILKSAYVVIPGGIYINDMKVKNGQNGLFFEMPGKNYQDAEGNWKTSYYAIPASKESREAIMKQVQEAYDAGKYRKFTSEKDKLLVGFLNLKVETPVSVRVMLAEKDGVKRITTDYRSYEKDGEKKYVNFVGLTKDLAAEILTALENAEDVGPAENEVGSQEYLDPNDL